MFDFEADEGQRLLGESVQRFVEREYGFAARREAVASEEGWKREVWRRFAELGWLAVGLPQELGGFGGARETAVLMESFGRALVVEPWLASVAMASRAVALAGDAAWKEALLAPAMRGETLLALAWAEPASRYDLAHVATRAERLAGGGWRLRGRKGLVLNGAAADRLVVTARIAGGTAEKEGIALFVVDPAAEGVAVQGYATNDGGRAAEAVFDGVTLDEGAMLGEADGFAAIEEVVDRAAAAVCAESLGLMAALNEMTFDYARTRRQFDQAIAGFQALQHRMVDMFVALEESRSLVAVATGDVDSPDGDERRRAVSAMKVQCDKAGRKVGQEAIQLHGGIAMTDDYAASHYFKRLSVIARLFGDLDWHLERYAALAL